jgi:Inositol-pentakisphosphate 2-kinase
LQELINLDTNEATLYGASQGVLMPDVTLLPLSQNPSPPWQSSSQHPATVCIEIKPKYGSITKCSTIQPDDIPLKHTTSRYQLHQLLKQDQGTISTVSSYDPLDLFSGKSDRIEKALHGLLNNPQNNLNAFINGRPIDLVGNSGESHGSSNYGDSGEKEETLLIEPTLATAAALLIPPPPTGTEASSDISNKMQSLVKLLRSILQQEPVLQNISKAQQACHLDIQGISYLHNLMMIEVRVREERKKEENIDIDLNGSPLLDIVDPVVCRQSWSSGDSSIRDGDDKKLAEREHRDALDDVHRMPWKERINMMRSYVIATTAKDCSIMITMRKVVTKEGFGDESQSIKNLISKLQTEEENGSVVFCTVEEKKEGKEVVLHSFEYRISVVDLDRKSTSKIPKHYELDQEIMEVAKRHKRR